MNFRQTAILLGAVLALGVVLLIVTWSDDKPPVPDRLVDDLVNVKTADIDTVGRNQGEGARVGLRTSHRRLYDGRTKNLRISGKAESQQRKGVWNVSGTLHLTA